MAPTLEPCPVAPVLLDAMANWKFIEALEGRLIVLMIQKHLPKASIIGKIDTYLLPSRINPFKKTAGESVHQFVAKDQSSTLRLL